MSPGAPSAYFVLLYCGCVAGIYLGSRTAESIGLDPSRFALASIALVAVGLLGAQGLQRWRAGKRGAAIYGGLLAIVPASLPVLAIAGLPFWRYWEAASIAMLVGLIITKFGCMLTGCCAGRETPGPWGVLARNSAGTLRKRYPAQLLEAAAAMAILAIITVAPARGRFATALFAYGAARAALEQIREDQSSRRSNDAVSAALVLTGCAIYAFGNDAW